MRWHNPSSVWRTLWKLITMTVNDITNQARLDLVFWLLAVAGQGDGWPSILHLFISKVRIKSSLTCFPILKVKKIKQKKKNKIHAGDGFDFFLRWAKLQLSLSQRIQAHNQISTKGELFQLCTWANPNVSLENCSIGYPAIFNKIILKKVYQGKLKS